MNKYRPGFLAALALGLFCLQVPALAEVSSIPDMPHPRVGMCSARIENVIYFIGGAQNLQGRNILNFLGTSRVESFNFETNQWDTSLAPLNTPRVFACAAVLDDSIYVMGGVDSLGNVLSSVEVYSPETNTWHFTSNMRFAREGAAATVYNDHILVFGGGNPSDSVLLRQVEAYNPDDGSWKVLPYETIFGRAFHHVARIRNAVYIFGGIGATIGPISIVEKYVPDSGVVSLGVTWRNPRALFGAVTRNDSVIVISGSQSLGNNTSYPNAYFSDVEIFDFNSGDNVSIDSVSNWEPALLPRRGFVAAVGNQGRIYLFGGQAYYYKSGTVPIPTVAETGPMPVTAAINNARTLPDGFSLNQNYPNPFNPATEIRFAVPAPGSRVSLVVYNMLGEKVRTLVDGYFSTGTHAVTFNGGNLPSGAYIYRLETEKGNIFRKMVLIK